MDESLYYTEFTRFVYDAYLQSYLQTNSPVLTTEYYFYIRLKGSRNLTRYILENIDDPNGVWREDRSFLNRIHFIIDTIKRGALTIVNLKSNRENLVTVRLFSVTRMARRVVLNNTPLHLT